MHKRLWEITKSGAFLDEAVRAYERGFYLRNDYYNGINFAFLLNVRAANAVDPADAIADFVLARRVRKEVLTICEDWLASNPAPVGPAANEKFSSNTRKADTGFLPPWPKHTWDLANKSRVSIAWNRRSQVLPNRG